MITNFLRAAEAYRLAFKKRVAAWDAASRYPYPATDPEAVSLIEAYHVARDEFQAADYELGKFLTGDEPLTEDARTA